MRAASEIAIGELSRRTQCNIETIRYYERIGLLPPPHRHDGRFRRYDADDVARLRFIRRARQLGFTLDEVRALMRLAGTEGDNACADVCSIATAHVAEIRAKIADLQAMERVLAKAICECESGQRPPCPLIEVLSRETSRATANAQRTARPETADTVANAIRVAKILTGEVEGEWAIRVRTRPLSRSDAEAALRGERPRRSAEISK